MKKQFSGPLRALWMGFPCLAALALAAISSAQSYPPAWSSRATYASGDQVQTGGNIYRAIKAVTANQSSPATNSASWQLSQVLSNTTLMIGVNQTFPTLVAAWNYAINARVADGVYLHFYIATTKGNFAETFTSPFLLDHGSGARMAILGDQVANITLSFSGGNGLLSTPDTPSTRFRASPSRILRVTRSPRSRRTETRR